MTWESAGKVLGKLWENLGKKVFPLSALWVDEGEAGGLPVEVKHAEAVRGTPPQGGRRVEGTRIGVHHRQSINTYGSYNLKQIKCDHATCLIDPPGC